MTSPPLQLALREWRRHLTHPMTIVALVGVSALLAIVGPFGTVEMQSLPERAAYWGALVVLGYACGYVISFAFLRGNRPFLAHALRVMCAGLLTGVAMTVIVSFLNWVAFGFWTQLEDLPTFMVTITAISVIVMGLMDYFTQRLATDATETDLADTALPLMDRLSFENRGPLVALSVEDHYVRVQTAKGTEMILMRLTDAMREVGKTPGAQVHRSHWAAFDQVETVRRQGDRAILRMSNGADIPVSRANVHKLKEAGLLP